MAAVVAAGLGLSGCRGLQAALSTPSPRATAPGAGTARPGAGDGDHRLLAVHDPRHVTGSLSGPCRARDHGQLPDPSCTPGSVDPAVTQADIRVTICRSGYTSAVRPPESQTEHFKWDVAEPAYGQHDVSGELDHLVPLELGGANDASNLWVEAGPIPNHKDAVEDALNQAVCDGRMTLRAAQEAIASNWIKAGAAPGG